MKTFHIILKGKPGRSIYDLPEQLSVQVEADSVETAIVLAYERAREKGFYVQTGTVKSALSN